jgi:hypothetical protein
MESVTDSGDGHGTGPGAAGADAGAGAGAANARDVPTDGACASAVEARPPSALSDAGVSCASGTMSPPVQGRRRVLPRLRPRHAETASPTIASTLDASPCSSHHGDDTSL